MIKKTLKHIGIIAVFFLSFTAFFSAKWYIDVFGTIGFRSILFTLFSPMEGTASGIVTDWLLKGLLPPVICTALLYLFCFIKMNIKPFIKKAVCIIICMCLWGYGIWVTQIPLYLRGMVTETDIYDTYYVAPNTTKITFPKEKQNLVYILLESMETTYFSENDGGGLKENVIPELYHLAQKNTNFSQNEGVGGWPFVTDTSWTSAAIVAQTAGVPLTLPLFDTVPPKDSNLLPKITTINDILHDNGYTQTVMFGSKGNFGGRANFFSQHGVDRILDHTTAQTDGIIKKGYNVWWGMEDSKLYEYAKKELTALAQEDKPFNFTLLTADTHHIAGYKCNMCDNQFGNQYENVLHCSSKQAYDFVEWIKTQPFNRNTTIIIVGDHCSMDAQFFADNMNEGYTRRVFNCIINPRATAQNSKNRTFTPMDMLPTTLAAIGCEIEGDRLGLGSNLFTNQKTLAEEINLEKLNNELNRSSNYYKENFIG